MRNDQKQCSYRPGNSPTNLGRYKVYLYNKKHQHFLYDLTILLALVSCQ